MLNDCILICATAVQAHLLLLHQLCAGVLTPDSSTRAAQLLVQPWPGEAAPETPASPGDTLKRIQASCPCPAALRAMPGPVQAGCPRQVRDILQALARQLRRPCYDRHLQMPVHSNGPAQLWL